MNKETARARARECRTIAEQFASNEIAKNNWEAMAEDYEALAAIADEQEQGQSSFERSKAIIPREAG